MQFFSRKMGRAYKFFVSLFFVIFISLQPAFATPLDDYVAVAEPNYTYSLYSTVPGTGYTAYILDMKSQNWRSLTEVDRTLWQHWVIIIVPSTLYSDKSLLFIDSGSNGDSPSVDTSLISLALATHTIVTDLKFVPNQPLTFADENQPRREDALLAYTFDKYMDGGDSNWPALLPMTKSAVKAMDTVNQFMYTLSSGTLDIDEFVVSGASKRGWTTWLTSAVDSRVIAIIPAVIDVLNMNQQMRHHYSAYGFYSSAIQDYVDLDIFSRLGTYQGNALLQIIDPCEYLSRLSGVPKLIINSTGDQFFPPDSSQFYFQNVIGTKYLRYIPNTDHSLQGSDATTSLAMFYEAILTNLSLPRFSWTLPEDGSIVVTTIDTPVQVNLWKASNPNDRDFRLETIGAAWTSATLTSDGNGVYTAQVPEPNTGWTAFFVELIYNTNGLLPPYQHKFTTQVRVIPDCLPYAYKLGFDSDNDIDFADLAIFVQYWLTDESLVDITPLCGDGIVNFRDFATFVSVFAP